MQKGWAAFTNPCPDDNLGSPAWISPSHFTEVLNRQPGLPEQQAYRPDLSPSCETQIVALKLGHVPSSSSHI